MKQTNEVVRKGKIGLEIHAYVLTKEKLFCRCKASRERGLQGNKNICPICTGQPGAKPMLPNGEALKKAVQIGLMLGCKINSKLVWQRKHYDWPDLPKGYQNTLSGAKAFPVGIMGEFASVKISSMHLEEDPASWEPETGKIDYNRSGLPLVEIVTEPDFADAEEVVSWLKKLLHSLAYLKAVDSNAGVKVDVNVNLENTKFSSPSIAKQQAIVGILGKTERVEIKNISSLDSIEKAINYELERQEKEGGKKKETRRYDDLKGKTELMREKEGAEDYRFISDPDLADIGLDKTFIDNIKKSLPESPDVKLEKLVKKYKIDESNAEVLAKNIDVVEFYEKIAESVDGKFALPWVTIELLRFLHHNNSSLDKANINTDHFIALLRLVKEGKITPLKGKEILKKFYPASFMPSASEGKITDLKELEKYALVAIGKNKKAVEDYNNGEKNALNFLMGEIMKETDKRADFKIAKEVLERLLRKR